MAHSFAKRIQAALRSAHSGNTAIHSLTIQAAKHFVKHGDVGMLETIHKALTGARGKSVMVDRWEAYVPTLCNVRLNKAESKFTKTSTMNGVKVDTDSGTILVEDQIAVKFWVKGEKAVPKPQGLEAFLKSLTKKTEDDANVTEAVRDMATAMLEFAAKES